MTFRPQFFSALVTVFLLSAASVLAQGQALVATSFGEPGIDEQALAVRQLPNGSIFLGGSTSAGPLGGSDITLSRITPMGDTLLWTKYFGSADSDFCHYMNTVNNDGFVLAGSTYSGSAGSIPNGIIIRTDTAGGVIFQKIYGQPNTADSFNFVEHTSDNGYIVCGFTSNTRPNGVGNDALVVKYDALGEVEWKTILGGYDNDYAQEVHQTSDGGYIVGVDSKSYNMFGFYDCIAYKLDSAGNEVWHTIAGGDTLDTGNQGVIITAAGDYILFGEAGSTVSPGFDLTIAKVHRNGELLWQHHIPEIGTEAAFSAIEMPNTNLLLTGYSNANTAGNDPTDAFILELDSAGTPINYTYIGGNENEITYDIQHSPFGGYLISGATQTNGSFDYYLLLFHYPGPVATPAIISTHKAGMQLFPNPAAKGQPVSLVLPEGEFTLSLHDQTGRPCWTTTTTGGTSGITLPATLQQGVYMLRAANPHFSATQKVVITPH